MLRGLIDDDPDVVTPHFFMLAMLVDIHLSSTIRKRLIFDYDSFARRLYQGMWSKVDSYVHILVGTETIPRSPDGVTTGIELDQSVSLEPLRSLIIRWRKVIALEKLIAQREDPSINTTAIFFSISSHGFVDEGRFVSFYIEKIKNTCVRKQD